MALNCEVCEQKSDEILFLRTIIKDLLEKRKQDEKLFTPFYENEMGETVPTQQGSENVEHID